MTKRTVSETSQDKGKDEPRLRHEFVGMMFAVTIAEVGLQVAALVQKDDWVHYLPAYSHLFLATVIVGASWVGWSLSPAVGARQDVRHVLHLGFLVLLTDVFLVVLYFILVRSVDFAADRRPPYIAPIPKVTFWIVFMFGVYLFWDLITKLPFFYQGKFDRKWFLTDGIRILATLLCVLTAWALKRMLNDPDKAHYMAADFALLGLILFFRALKDICSSFFPRDPLPDEKLKAAKNQAVVLTIFCCLIMVGGIAGAKTKYSPSNRLIQKILSESSDEKPRPEKPFGNKSEDTIPKSHENSH